MAIPHQANQAAGWAVLGSVRQQIGQHLLQAWLIAVYCGQVGRQVNLDLHPIGVQQRPQGIYDPARQHAQVHRLHVQRQLAGLQLGYF